MLGIVYGDFREEKPSMRYILKGVLVATTLQKRVLYETELQEEY